MSELLPPHASEAGSSAAEFSVNEGPTPPPSRSPHHRPGQEGGRRATNRKARLEALQRAGLELFLVHGVENATVDAIAALAGTAKGNFYRYVADKRELVASLVAPVFETFEAAFTRCAAEVAAVQTRAELSQAYLKLALGLFACVTEHPDVVRLYLQECRAPGVGAREPIAHFERWIAAKTMHLTQLAFERGLIERSSPEVSALVIIGAVERLVIAYLQEGAFKQPHEIIAQFISLMMGGLSGPTSNA